MTPITTIEVLKGTQSTVDPKANVALDPHTREPYTNEYSVGVDREIGRQLALSASYIRKDGHDLISWIDTGGAYRTTTVVLSDGSMIPVQALTSGPASRRFLLTNPDGYSLTYNGLVLVAEAVVPRVAGLRVVHVLARVRPPAIGRHDR